MSSSTYPTQLRLKSRTVRWYLASLLRRLRRRLGNVREKAKKEVDNKFPSLILKIVSFLKTRQKKNKERSCYSTSSLPMAKTVEQDERQVCTEAHLNDAKYKHGQWGSSSI